MSINFPDSPTFGQIYSFMSTSWRWNGIYWEVYSTQDNIITHLVTLGSGATVVSGVSAGTGYFYSIDGINIEVFNSGDTLYVSGETPFDILDGGGY